MPDLIERIMCNSTASVGQARVFPLQNNGNVSRETLLCAVDVINVDDPYSDGDFSWARAGIRSLD
jgi:hypothetical protein